MRCSGFARRILASPTGTRVDSFRQGGLHNLSLRASRASQQTGPKRTTEPPTLGDKNAPPPSACTAEGGGAFALRPEGGAGREPSRSRPGRAWPGQLYGLEQVATLRAG